MTTQIVQKGSRLVIINKDEDYVSARLYLYPDVASGAHWEGKTVKGATRWANNILRRYDSEQKDN